MKETYGIPPDNAFYDWSSAFCDTRSNGTVVGILYWVMLNEVTSKNFFITYM